MIFLSNKVYANVTTMCEGEQSDYLCDDTWSDLQRLDGGRLGHQRDRALHSHRVTRRLVGVGGETCERTKKDKL